MKVGIISANWGIVAHLPAWRAVEGVEVVAICTSREETARAAAVASGIARPYWDYRAMAADADLDIIDVGTRPDLREPMMRAAFAAGKHVLAGAVFAPNVVAARQLVADGHASGKRAAIDSSVRWSDAQRRMGELITQGYVGRPASVSLRFQNALFSGSAAIGRHWQWFGRAPHGASALRNLGTHGLHALIALFGPVVRVTAQTQIIIREWDFGQGETMRPNTPDWAQLLLQFRSGVLADVQLGWSAQAADIGWRLEVTGDAGVLITEDPDPFPTSRGLTLSGARSGAALAELTPSPDDVPTTDFATPPERAIVGDMARNMAAFVEDIRRGDGGELETILHVEEILSAALIASNERRWIDLPPLA